MKKFPLIAVLGSAAFLGAGCMPGNPPEVVTPDSSRFVAPEKIPDQPEASVPESNPSTPPMQTYAFPGVLPDAQIKGKQVRISTTKGEIVFELFPDTAPKTVSNFVYLANVGYYNGLTFHRRESWVLQGGDPTGTGSGGPGYKFEDELSDRREYKRGIVAMANAGKNTNGSQFFILVKDTPLRKDYTIFGQVLSGMEVVDQLGVGDVMGTVAVEEKK